MVYYMYVALQGDNKISVHSIDHETGKLTPIGDSLKVRRCFRR